MKAACVFLFAFCLAAQDQTSPSKVKNPVGTGVQDPVVDFHDSLADYFRNTSRAVTEINRKGIPNEEIAAVLLIARRSSASPNQVIAARKGGRDFAEIAKENKVSISGTDFVREANIIFLSEYHGRSHAQVRQMLEKGADFIQINQELRRGGNPAMPLKTEQQK